MANGVRQICLLLIPSAVLMAVLAVPVTRLVYQRGAFGSEATDLVSEAMVWWSISLPFQGVSLLFSRTFFSLQRPWATTALAGRQPRGERRPGGGPVRAVRHRRDRAGHGGRDGDDVRGARVCCCAGSWAGWRGASMLGAAARMLLAALPLAGAAYGVWYGLDAELGRSFPAQAVSVLTGITAGVVAYAAAVWVLRVPEARQIRRLLMSRRAASG